MDENALEAMNEHIGAHHRLLIFCLSQLRQLSPVGYERLLADLQDRRDSHPRDKSPRPMELEVHMMELAMTMSDLPEWGGDGSNR
ncbi:MAG: hypothetical protein KF842_06885 [Caulobacter sp.]|nr:hypothetical protein [Caulobacter sp.]